MTPHAQRTIIAEFCGWQEVGDSYWYPPNGEHAVRDCPAYLNDLNAMHEAEKLLDANQRMVFGSNLYAVTGAFNGVTQRRDCWKETHATAAQRAEALLRTIGKWTE